MIQLFRKGTSHVVDGITCEMILASPRSYKNYLGNGWYLTPKEANEAIEKVPEPIKKPVEKPVEKTKKDVFKNLAHAIKS